MSTMTTFHLVMPADMNPDGALFGGNMLKWVDETAWMAASQDYPGARFVTIGMDRVAFKRQVPCGIILRFDVTRRHEGHTSVAYDVMVTNASDPADTAPLFETEITFVRVSAAGTKLSLHA